MSFTDSATFRCNFHRYDGPDQLLQIRIGHSSRLLTGSPFSGYPFNIVHETLPTTMADAQFPLPLRELEDPLFCRACCFSIMGEGNPFLFGEMKSLTVSCWKKIKRVK